MSEYSWVEEIVVKQLSNRALVLVSRFARILKQVNGNVLVLQDPMLAKNMVREVTETDDPRLKRIFDDLLLEFHAMADNKDSAEKPNSATDNAHNDDGHVADDEVQFYRGVPIAARPRSSATEPVKKKMTYRGVDLS